MSNTYLVGAALQIAAFSLLTIGFHTAHARDNLLTLHAAYIYEKQTLKASSAAGLSNPSNTLNTWHTDGTFLFHAGYAFSVGYLSTTESTDALVSAPGPVTGAAGNPNSNGGIVQATCLPWQNLQFTLQGWFCDKFHYASGNYDGSGRSASNNNSVFLPALFEASH
jgi:hypothetical protein